MAFVNVVGEVASIVSSFAVAAGGSNGRTAKATFHYRLATRVAAPTKTALEVIFQSTVCVPYMAAASSRVSQISNGIRHVGDALDPTVETARAVVGAIATDGSAMNAAVFMLLKSAYRGANYKGSKHFVGVSEVDTTYDVLTGAGLARWVTLQNALAASLTDSLGNIWNPSLLSRTLSQLSVNPTTVSAVDIVSVSLNLNIGTMRRRRTDTIRV